jgi:hypothetical protein
MSYQAGIALAGALALAVLQTSEARAEKKPVKPTKEWTGAVADEKLLRDAPAVVVSKEGLEKLWKAWMLEGKAPDIDFTKELLVVQTSRGSVLKLADAALDDKGNLQVIGVGTRDLRPGFRYVLATFGREGVKTVNGKELPKE